MNYNQLTENERYQIYAMNKAGHSQKETAEFLGRSASKISRELRRNRGLRGYRPAEAQRFSQARRREAHKARKITLEFAGHELIAQGLGADIYFAHPCASWARGINENTHGLIRQYFPKGTDFNEVSDEHIKQIMERLNNWPGKTRSGRSLNELFMG